MPIVITPQGEYIDDQTGMPADPKMIQQLDPRSSARQGELMGFQRMLDPRSVIREGEMARENIPANLDMGMDSEMAAADLSDVDKVRMLIDMGLSPTDAMEAVAREKMSQVNPSAFGGQKQAPNPGMGAMGAPSPVPRGATDMGMPENGVVADLMRRGYSPDMISAMIGGNMPPREDDAMNLERTGPPMQTPMR
jgi:hypothetical protein